MSMTINEKDVPNPKKFKLDGCGWLQIKGRKVEIVRDFEKVPGLKYFHRRDSDGYAINEYVVVHDDVGRLVELYLSLDDNYANMELNEFIVRALADTFGGTENSNKHQG
jgi:hypothetical protein